MDPILGKAVEAVIAKGKDKTAALAIARMAKKMCDDAGTGDDEATVVGKAVEMCNEMGEKKFELDTFDLPAQEIFAAGSWNGDTYTDQDLEDMAQAYRETAGTWGVPIKLSHDHPSHLPAVGWVENVRRVGSKLMADFKRIPKKIYDLIRAGGYRGKSAEIFWNAKVNDKTYPFLLKAVAILGVDPKAVQSINDLVALYGAAGGHTAKAYEGAGESKSYDLGDDTKEEGKMEELKAKLAEAEKNYADAMLKVKELGDALVAEKTGRASDVDAATRRAVDAEGKLAEYAAKETQRQIGEIVDTLITDGKLAPAKKEYAAVLLAGLKLAGEKKYKLADKEYSLEQVAMELLSEKSVALPTEEESEVGARQAADLDSKAKEYMAKHDGVSYKDALRAVAPSGK